MSVYRVPVDLFVEAPSQEIMINNVRTMITLFYKDLGVPFGLVDFTFPVGMPEDPDDSYST